MLVLGIETATPQVGVAIGGHEGVIASFHTARDRRHAETLAPAIQFLCAQTQLELNDIGVVAVDIGPGLFTGLRVGLATAKAVAHACKVPMIGISSLDLAAFPARFSDRLIVSTVDARRGEIFYATYRKTAGGIQRISEPHVDHQKTSPANSPLTQKTASSWVTALSVTPKHSKRCEGSK